MAFLSSLSTDRADWRSGLASWHFAKALNFHVYKEEAKVTGYYYEAGVSKPHIRHTCAICGADGAYANEDLNVLNFERIRWDGVRHGSWIYTLLDLQQLYESEIPNPTNEDILIFEKILQTIASSASNDHPGTLRDRLGSVLRATKDQRSTLLEILAAVGVLRPQSTDRPNTGGRNDWKFVEYWRGEDGYDEQALHEYFHKVE